MLVDIIRIFISLFDPVGMFVSGGSNTKTHFPFVCLYVFIFLCLYYVSNCYKYYIYFQHIFSSFIFMLLDLSIVIQGKPLISAQ